MKNLKNKISTIKAYGGGGNGAEDWVGGYELTLNNMN